MLKLFSEKKENQEANANKENLFMKNSKNP